MLDVCLKCGAEGQLLFNELGDVAEYRSFTNAMLELDRSIRCVAILNDKGEMEASRMKPGSIPPVYLDQQFGFRVLLVNGLGKTLGETGFGSVHYTVIKYDHASLCFLSNPQRVVLVICEPNINHELLERVRESFE